MRKLVLPLVLAAFLLIMGCPSPSSSTSGGSPPGNGSLTINLPFVQVKSVRGPNDIVVSYFDVSGSGPGKATFLKQGIRDTSVTIDSLPPGDWGVMVNGNNFSGLLVASASVHVAVVAGETATRDVVVSEVVSKGTLDVSLEWPVSRNITSVIVSLTPGGGVPFGITMQPIVPTKDGFSVSGTAAVSAGYYTLTRVFSDGTGGADAVRIISGSTTKLALSVVSGMDLTITPDISKVIPITFDGYKTNIGLGSEMILTAKPTISKPFSSFSYQWYLDGSPLVSQTANTVSIKGSDYPGGSHRLDCVVTSQGILCSDHVSFSITGI